MVKQCKQKVKISYIIGRREYLTLYFGCCVETMSHARHVFFSFLIYLLATSFFILGRHHRNHWVRNDLIPLVFPDK